MTINYEWLREIIGFLPEKVPCKLLEIGGAETALGEIIKESEKATLSHLTFDLITSETKVNQSFYEQMIHSTDLNHVGQYDIILVPYLFNQLKKKEAFTYLDQLLSVVNQHVFIVLNEFESQEPLFIPDFKGYDITYFRLQQSGYTLIKVFKQTPQMPEAPLSLLEEVGETKLTILYVMPHKNLTGGLKMLYEQMKSLQKKGHAIYVILRGNVESVVPHWVEGFIPDKEMILKHYERYTDYLDGVDIVFAGFYNQINELENGRVPVLYWEQGHEALYGDVREKQLEMSYRQSMEQQFKRDIYLATDSTYVHDIVKCRFNRESYVLPIFIDTNFYSPLEAKEEKELLTILLIGNPLLAFKGFEKALVVLLNAWNQGYRFRVEWACQVKPAISALPFEIVYHENVSQLQLAEVYRQADLLLTCSLYEGCPMPPLEAMASGVPVISTNSGGINQYAIHGENALIAHSNTILELLELLKMALTNEGLRKKLIKNGLETAIRLNYDHGSVLLEKILLSVVKAEQEKKAKDSRKKVLFMIGTLHGGGAEKVLCNVVKHLDKQLFDVTVQTVYDAGIYVEEIKKHATYRTIYKTTATCEEEAEVIKLHQAHLNQLSEVEFSRAVIKEAYDIEVAFLEDQSTRIIAHSPNKNSRKLAWVHANLITEPGSTQFYRDFEHQLACYKQFNELAFVSQDVQKAFQQKFEMSDNCHVLYNPIETEVIKQKAKELIIEPKKFTIVAVGRLMPVKGIDRLLVAHRQLIQEGFDYELVIIGDGPNRALFEQFVKENQLGTHTRFLGFKENPYPYIAQADLMVSPSYTEGFSTVLTEALILGVPVVATACAGTNELIGESEYGLKVENNTQSIYEGLRQMFTHTIEYHRYRKLASTRGQQFNLKESMAAVEAFLLGEDTK